ncbi:acireductone synthase [Pendulispora rubella]|uniref:Enolase-phosphatase E1 n=1 Tax=Pendulispora rubella TaxID=2741070 RepID=A0ABZ2KYM4_9BACT
MAPPPQVVLLDIEGTTTDISFVHDVLFPLSRRALPEYIAEHWNDDEVLRAREATGANDMAGLIDHLTAWIDADRKEPTLKAIQGKIWRGAFESGQVKSHVYPDVPAAFERWKARGIRIAIFSSGSIEAQELLFRHSEHGDLTGFLSGYFDPTTAGPKREVSAYEAIVRALGTNEVAFLSDVSTELEAARAAGLSTWQLVRPGIADDAASTHAKVRSFALDELGF